MTTLDPCPHVSAIIGLAEEIERLSPECAERAFKIMEFARELGDAQPDRTSIQEAIESEMLAEARSRTMTAAVLATMKPAKDEGEDGA